jgi:putative acetyltransferase
VSPDGEVVLAIEDPTEGESAAMIAELVAFLTPLYPEDGEEGQPPWTAHDMARTRTFVVARVAGAAAGCGGLTALPIAGAMEIVRMFVRPGFRGRGVADLVLAELEALAQRRGAEVLMLRCGPRQPDALRVYERNGYVRRRAFAHHREHDTNVFYEKRLPA